MKRVKVQFDVEVPDNATYKEIEDWIRFEVGETGQLDGKNPMADRDLEAIRDSVWVR